MKHLTRKIVGGSMNAAGRATSVARNPAAPFRAVRDLYRPDDDFPDVYDEMTLQDHLVEVRDRIMRIVIVIVPLFILGFFLTPALLEEIKVKANATEGLDIRSPTDPLTLYFKVSLYIAVALGMPVIVYQFVAFLTPGLRRAEKRVLFTALPFVTLLFITGVAYAYFVAAPQALYFLSTFQSAIFSWQPDGNETLSFFLTLMLGLGLSFQLPVIMFILAKIGVVTPTQMREWRRYAVLLVAVASAVITPSTDPINMAIVAIPLYVLYEFGIVISSIFARTSLRSA
ncbi:MAG: twin-arginine translocase subunit TatC [Thermomicrobiales bacterium]